MYSKKATILYTYGLSMGYKLQMFSVENHIILIKKFFLLFFV